MTPTQSFITNSDNDEKNSDFIPMESCLVPLLKALKWRGTHRTFVEALPHFTRVTNVTQFIEVMKKIGYAYKRIDNVHLNELDSRLYPVLFISEDKSPAILMSRHGSATKIFSGEDHKLTVTQNNLYGTVYHFVALTKSTVETDKARKRSWFYLAFRRNGRLIAEAFLLSFLINVLTLAVPFYIMSIYDKVIATKSYEMLGYFALGIGIITVGAIFLHRLRTRIMSYLGSQLDRDIGNAIFDKLLRLEPQYLEAASVESQIARIRDFDYVRHFFTSPFLVACFDLPYIVLFIIAMYFLGGSIAWVSVGIIVAYAILTWVSARLITEKAALNGFYSNRREEFLIESVNHMEAVRKSDGQETWFNRFRDFSADACIANMQLQFQNQVLGTLYDMLLMLGALSVMLIGVFMVFDNQMTVGALVASMIIIWRILGPIKTFFSSLPRLKQVANSISQINRLMDLPSEGELQWFRQTIGYNFKGAVQFNHISFRYPQANSPALVGIDIKIPAGGLLMICGRNGSGKSTFLKLLCNMFRPQSGNITIDGRDIRQLDALYLRQAISYLPQNPDLFYGSILQNIQFSDPTSPFSAIVQATKLAGVYDEIMALPEQFHTMVKDNAIYKIPDSFRQKLCLARTFLKPSNVILLDEPSNHLDHESDHQLIEALKRLKGKKTVIMVTHRPSHLYLADYVIALDASQVVARGKPEKVVDKITKGLI